MQLSVRFLIVASAVTLTAGLSGLASTAEAQYFGRNKVQYENLDFDVLKTDHFDIHYYPEEGVAVEYAAIMAERWYARLSRLLNHELDGRQALILYASAPHFRQTNTLRGNIGEGTGGVTEIFKRRMVLPFVGPLKETDHVLGHELVHAFQFDITGRGGGIARAGIPTILRYPLWFTEGMAEYLSIGSDDPLTAMWMRDAVREELPDIRKLSNPAFFPYRYGQSLWAYIAGRWGDDAVGRILKASKSVTNVSVTFSRVLRVSPDSVVAQWHRALRDAYLPLVDQTSPPDDYGRALITKETAGGNLNFAPALSPDGKQIVFFSERDLFSIDMFLADVETGEIKGKITKTAVDPHFESIQFIGSAGSWDFEGRRFVFGAVHKGRPLLSIYDVERGKTEREIRLPELGEAFNPSWSPDGRSVAFSGLAGGLSDLYVYDLEADQLKRLTNDGYAALQPAWSPDGSTIAFVTDRFTMGLTSLLYGTYQLALIDPESGAIEPVPGFDSGKHINPQWAPDGESLYFISDQNGISNIYRVDLASEEITQLTNLYTGVAGITGLSPALTVAVGSGQIAMSVYLDDKYSIYYMDQAEVLAGGPVVPAFEGVSAGVLPPEDRLTSDVTELLNNAFFGLPADAAEFETFGYSAKLGLDYMGQPSLVVGADRFGTYIAGGVSFFWSDMLGGRNLATALQVQGSLKDIAGLVAYTNLSRRLNWTVAAQQTPFRTGFFQVVEDNGTIRQDLTILRQTNRQLVGVLAYPLSRVQRIEVSGGLLNVQFDREVQSTFFDPQTFLFLGETKQDLEAPSGLTMAIGSAALVYDNSLFGITGPILGQRYRLEYGGMVGDLKVHNVLADMRKYVMPLRPFTLAARVLHFGRYGPDADNDRLQPFYIGYDGLVRGYDFGSFDLAEECGGTFPCAAFDQLFGSKMAVANLELRFPILGVLGIGDGLFGFLPIDMIAFGDAGMAWHGTDLPETESDDRAFWQVAGGGRKPLFSAGAGLRMNVFGIMILGLDWVYPFNRNKGGHLQFSFTPRF